MTVDDIRAWDHYQCKGVLYLIVDVLVDSLVLMKVEYAAPGAERKFKTYLKSDFIYLVDEAPEEKRLVKCVPVVR